MEGTDDNKCLPADLWMSQIDPEFSGNLGSSSMRDARTVSSPAHLDLSRKQPPLYSNYGLSSMHYKQNAPAVTSSVMQQFAQPSTRSAWEFSAENFSSTSADLSSQTLSQSVTNSAPRYSQPIHDFTSQQNVPQPPERHFPPNSMPQSHRGYASEGGLLQQSVGNFMSQNTQPVREQVTHNVPQPNARSDRSVWSHLYSLDPSIASYGITGDTAQNTNFNQDKPYSYTLPRSEGSVASSIDHPALNMSAVPPEKPPLILGKIASSEQLPSSLMNRSSLPADSISSLAPTLYSNVIGSAKITKQNPSVSYEDEMGGYSPVSPPTHETSSSPFSALPNDQSADLSLKKNSFMMSSSNVSDFSSSSVSKTLSANHFMHSNPIISDSSMLQISHDVPLDMTKGWSSQNTDRAATAPVTCSSVPQPSRSVPQNAHPYGVIKDPISNQHSDMPSDQFAANQPSGRPNTNRIATHNPADAFAGNQITMNKIAETTSASQLAPNNSAAVHSVNQFSANLPTVVSESIERHSGNQFSTNISAEMHSTNLMSANKPTGAFTGNQFAASSPAANQFATIESTELSSAPQSNVSQKIAPKKSNFYGRDASFFSVPELSSQPSHTSLVDNTNVLSSSGAKFDPVLQQPDSNSTQAHCNPEINIPNPDESLLSSRTDSNGTSFADSFIDATTAPSPESDDKCFNGRGVNVLNDGKESENTSISIEANGETTSADGNLLTKQMDRNVDLKAEADDMPGDQLISKNEPSTSLEEDSTHSFNIPASTFTNTRGGKAPRGRKRRGGAAPRRQPKKAGKKALASAAVSFGADIVLGGDGTGVAGANAVGDVAMEASPVIITPPAPKARARRGRKRNLSTESNSNPDSEGSMTRRSSSRRSKDNAMRLIELQAESIYGHVSKPGTEEPPPQQPAPSKPRRKAAKAAVKSTTFSDNRVDEVLMGDKDISSEEMSDEKDADYAVDEEDVEAMEKEELLDLPKDQKKPIVEKKLGGLKISIKLGLDASAEIVSGLVDDSPPRKKKKVAKKKVVSQKFKSKAIIQDVDMEGDEMESEGKKLELEDSKTGSEYKGNDKDNEKEMKSGVEEKGGFVEKHNSLMDKYFSSATQVRQVPKPGSAKKDHQPKKLDASTKSKSSKTVKVATPKTNTVPSQSSSDGSKPSAAESNSDTGVPKFVCGYCPNRYHNKQELLSHMEAHMAEMEDKPEKASGGDSSVANVSKEPKKPSPPSKKSDFGKNVLPKVGKKAEVPEALKYNCGECGKSFSSKPNLLDHVRTHAAEKPFECNLCHKFFKERDQLSVHRKVHAQEGLHRCQFCQKGFVNIVDLTSHMESHPKRMKPSPLHPKHTGSDSLKKTANPVSDPVKKIINLPSDSSKKTSKTQPLSRDKEIVPSKPTSFASALEPTTTLEKNKDNPTLLLRRNDGSTSSSKDENKTAKPPKSVSNISKNSKELVKKSSSKAPDVKKEYNSKESLKKGSESTSGSKTESKESKEVDEKLKTSSKMGVASGECTCQECPDCVTRFLNSFE